MEKDKTDMCCATSCHSKIFWLFLWMRNLQFIVTKDVDMVDVKSNHINETNACETMYLDEFWKKYKMSEHIWELV